MKKVLVLLVCFTALQMNAHAQSLRFGVVVSPGISWFKSDISRISGDGSKIGLNIGLMADKYFAEHYAFSTGLTIHSLGGTIKYDEAKILETTGGPKPLIIGDRVHYKLQYLHVPIGLKFKTTEIGYSTFYADLGLDAMANIKARADVKERSISSANVGKEIDLLYLGYHFGAGIQYKIAGNTAILAGINYINGFTDVTSDDTERTFLHNFELKIGVIF